jgi:hypothetical protein
MVAAFQSAKKKVEVMGEKSDKSLQHDILLAPLCPR